MIKKVAALVLVVAAAVAVTAATHISNASHSEQRCTAALNADVDAFVRNPNAVQYPTSGEACDSLSDSVNTKLFYRVEQARATDIANAQIGN